MIAGETEVLGENLPSATLSHHKSHMPRSGFEPRTAAVVGELVRGLLRFSPCEALLLAAGSWGTGTVQEPRVRGTSAVESLYRVMASEDFNTVKCVEQWKHNLY
jgi:hypothetical protein